MVAFILFLTSLISNIFLALFIDRITEDYRKHPEVSGLHAVYCLLRVYKQTKRIKYLILFIVYFILFFSSIILLFVIDWGVVLEFKIWEYIRVGDN